MWGISDQSFYIGMQNVQNLETWSGLICTFNWGHLFSQMQKYMERANALRKRTP